MFIYFIIIINLLFCIEEASLDSALISIQDENKKNFFTSSYKLEQWLTSDGNSEGISGTWLERYFEPRNINLMNYDDLMALPNLTPLDANAVIKQKKLGDIDGNFIFSARRSFFVTNAPPSPIQPKFFVGKKLKQPISPIEPTLFPLYCAPWA